MAFPAAQQTLADGLAGIKREATSLKNYAVSFNAFTSANTSSANMSLDLLSRIKNAIDVWDVAAAIPGMVQYAKDQHDDQGLNIVAEYNAMKAAAIIARDWIIAAFPTSGGYILKDQLTADGSISVRQFTSANLVQLRQRLDDLIATIT
jgi:hypothetical protein